MGSKSSVSRHWTSITCIDERSRTSTNGKHCTNREAGYVRRIVLEKLQNLGTPENSPQKKNRVLKGRKIQKPFQMMQLNLKKDWKSYRDCRSCRASNSATVCISTSQLWTSKSEAFGKESVIKWALNIFNVDEKSRVSNTGAASQNHEIIS